ncbi:hypothetical protein [Amycolatopsis sp. NPDC059657]|uniref:hypothetical protein n=1 Tax=Amycolatopsis sp. NPDC059657 TaxID=3346899 RepID=UPI0036722471
MNSEKFLYRLQGGCLVIGPALFAASTFFWRPNGTYSAATGTLLVLALVFWTYGLIGVLETLRARQPVYASVVQLMLVYGAIGGAAFGVRGFYDELFSFSREQSVQALTTFGIRADLVFYWPGPLFPLSLLAIGIGLIRARTAPLWTSTVVCAVGVLFPLSRVPRVSWFAHVVDALIVVAFAYLGYLRFHMKPSRKTRSGDRSPVAVRDSHE